MIKGIKVLGKNMEAVFGDGMIYELDYEYHFDGEIKCCGSGYHYFMSIVDAMGSYKLKNCRIFECDIIGKTDHYGYYNCTDSIKLTREITQKEILKYIEDNVDILVKHWYYHVRLNVAMYGLKLDVLVNDIERDVRCKVTEMGYGYEKLVNDNDSFVRTIVARKGYGLDKLIHDLDCIVRIEAEKQLKLRNQFK